jgi:hypothetical protein
LKDFPRCRLDEFKNHDEAVALTGNFQPDIQTPDTPSKMQPAMKI